MVRMDSSGRPMYEGTSLARCDCDRQYAISAMLLFLELFSLSLVPGLA